MKLNHKWLVVVLTLCFLAGAASAMAAKEFTKDSLVLGLARLSEKADSAGMKKEAKEVRELWHRLASEKE